MSYIEREAALSCICNACDKHHPSEKELCPNKFTGCMEYYSIFELPAAEVRPVVKAYWIGEGDGYADGEMVYDVWSCSNCGYTVDEGDNEPPQYNFCPNCGADMREES